MRFIYRVQALIFSVYALLLIPQQVFSDSTHSEHQEGKKHVHGTHKECPLPKSTMDIVECAFEFHPSIKKSLLNIDISSKLIDKAKQIPNPTISSRYMSGENDNKKVSELETSLRFKLELGGKRDARKQHAIATKNKVLAESKSELARIKHKMIIKLYRLRQVLDEKKMLAKTLQAFSRVIKRLKDLPRLSAEQEASLTLFELAFEDTKISQADLFEEEKRLEHFVHIATGHSVDEIKSYLPRAYQYWPKISMGSNGEKSLEVKRLKSLSSIAAKELAIERSNAWPDLEIGPSVVVERSGGEENKMVGISVQFPIPFFQLNGGAKAYAKSQLASATKRVKLAMEEQKHERFEQVRIYQSSVKALSNTRGPLSVEKKYKRIEKLYLRGVVSSSVFLDSLTQKINYLRSRNKRELSAVNALWSVYRYDGKLLENKI